MIYRTFTAAVFLAGTAQAADPEAGAILATQCAGCHGVAGVSTEASIPNLAAQKSEYIAAQLKAFRSGDRDNALMNAIAAQLEDADIDDLAAHFAGLPGARPGEVGEANAALGGALPEFPGEDFKNDFTLYHTISFDDRKQVRHYYADNASVEAARRGKNLPDGAFFLVEVFKAREGDDGKLLRGDDDHFIEGDFAVYTAMQKQEGWGDDVPAILRNGDWRYAVFSPEGDNREGLNEGRCLACHQPLDDTDFLFTLQKLEEHAAK